MATQECVKHVSRSIGYRPCQQQRLYTSSATAEHSVHRSDESNLSSLPTSDLVSNNIPPMKSSTSVLLEHLDKAIKNQERYASYTIYTYLRRRALHPKYMRPWFNSQIKLLRLLHYRRIKETSPTSTTSRTMERKEDMQNQILCYLKTRIFKEHDNAEALTALVDAIAHSKALLKLAGEDLLNSQPAAWREALRVLEDCAAEYVPLLVQGSPGASGNVNNHSSDLTMGLWKNSYFESELSALMTKLMGRLVYTHTYLVRTSLDNMSSKFGIQSTVQMHTILLRYYAMLGRGGCQDALSIIAQMDAACLSWKQDPAVYDYLLHSLSHMPDQGVLADQIVRQMLSNDVIPREHAMKAALLCAARSGDLEACSRYIECMHQDWGLTVSDRMKAILIYVCAKRGDFDSALELLKQLSISSSGLHSGKRDIELDAQNTATTDPPQETPEVGMHDYTLSDILSSQSLINKTNLLLARINQSYIKYPKMKQSSQELMKEEVADVLELFSSIIKDPKRSDTHLYTIMMQYLSTLPSPLPGMMYLYNDMRASKRTKPNSITYKIMLEACAEHLEMEIGERLWKEMKEANIPADCHVRSVYVKGWGKLGHLAKAEWISNEGLAAQKIQDELRRSLHFESAVVRSKSKTTKDSVNKKEAAIPPSPPRLVPKMISLTVLHELMRANRSHNRPERVLELYQEIYSGQWGRSISPNQFTLSIVLQACSSRSTRDGLIDRAIEFADHYITQRRLWVEQDVEEETNTGEKARTQSDSEFFGMEEYLASNGPSVFSDFNYQLYYAMLGKHHRQHKLVEVWKEMMKTIEYAPSHLTVNLATEALENVQWGAGPIKEIRKELRQRWPSVDWASRGRRLVPGDADDDVIEGAGGRFWR
ncbi:hypothetical protein BGW38_004644 [Lunasporangiospora selenospora]|uniref:Uncharacterized protein n=1 Tax=Lunasporangiospora selenospora TaxID=979761 RepID=A0A9P6G160_9FUNG|nr:hypothetical protein BGW38_004644 [Lunasporangiospora selenospora]